LTPASPENYSRHMWARKMINSPNHTPAHTSRHGTPQIKERKKKETVTEIASGEGRKRKPRNTNQRNTNLQRKQKRHARKQEHQ